MKRKKGFTLIEIILTLGILSVVGLMAFTLFGQGFNLYRAETESADLQDEMRLVLSDITNKVRLTDEEDISAATNQLTVDTYVYSLDGNRLVRNTSELASNIAVFDVSLTDGLLEVRLRNIKGTQISTSIYLSD
jgi:prepilin-type N-terminal cleavage/methylation domain-containing protein